jgi:glycolate oxidase FAD binding subunit
VVAQGPCAVDGLVPREIVHAKTVQEVAGAVARASTNKQAIIPIGGGTKMGLGNIPRAADVMVCTTDLNRVLEYEPADLVVTVQAGIRLGGLQRVLGEHGQFLALDPPLPEQATVGGIIAANASGPLRLRYGTCRDQLIGVTVVSAEGRITKGGGKVVKNVTGYDMCKLYTGSLGSLGVIVEASFKLAPLPQLESTALASFSELRPAYAAARAIYKSALPVLACELLSPEVAKSVVSGLSNDPRNVLVPAAGKFLLAIRIGGGSTAVARQNRDAMLLCGNAESIEVLWDDEHRRLWRRIEDFGRGQFETIAKASVMPSRMDELLAPLGPDIAYVSHVLSGVTYVFGADPEPLTPLVQALGGYVVLEACPLEAKRRLDVWGPVGPDFRLMKRIKREFDPDGILNPGRYVGGL